LIPSRPSLYYKPIPPTAEEIAVKHRIDEIYTESPFYGSRKITGQLRREGVLINRKAVQRHMREMGIAGITPEPNLSRRAQGHRVFPYLPLSLVIERPNQVWGIDITYIRLLGGWLYLAAIIDWFSRYTVAWELDETLEMPFVLECAERGLSQATPEIWNGDQGSHFISPLYTERLQQAGLRISMDGKGRALDNILTERLWRTLKYEEVYLHDYANPKAGLSHSTELRRSTPGQRRNPASLPKAQAGRAIAAQRIPCEANSCTRRGWSTSQAWGRNP
jgi:putative transposase